jgi:hypothetical protein
MGYCHICEEDILVPWIIKEVDNRQLSLLVHPAIKGDNFGILHMAKPIPMNTHIHHFSSSMLK